MVSAWTRGLDGKEVKGVLTDTAKAVDADSWRRGRDGDGHCWISDGGKADSRRGGSLLLLDQGRDGVGC